MNDSPRFALAVLIATHNRRAALGRCLEALAGQSASPDSFEVIVADDGSEDDTQAFLAAARTPFRLSCIHLPKAGKPAALNAALEAAEADSCLFIDDDVIAAADLIAEHAAAHQGQPDTLALGKLVQRPPAGRDPYAAAAAVRWDRRYEEFADRSPDWADCYGANFSAPRRALLEIGGFDADLEAIEDLEIGFRLCRAGCVPVYLPAAEALHDDDKPGARILRHEQRFGEWCVDFAAAHPKARRRLLGWFPESTPREVALRRLLLRFRLSPATLVAAGHLVPGRGRRQVWFDFTSRYTFWHGVKRASSREEWSWTVSGTPVLMYHAFTDRGERSRYVLGKREFARQMRLLAALRYRVVEFEALADALREGRALPRRTVAITVDDGYADNHDIAFPILRRHGFAATFFLVSRRLGELADWSSDGGPTQGRALLTAEQAAEMRDAGMSIGAHTRTHPSLPNLTADAASGEIAGSRADLEATLGVPVATFAYPYGELDAEVVGAVDRASFRAACSTEPKHARFGDDPLAIPRIEVRGTDSTLRFLRKLCLGGQ